MVVINNVILLGYVSDRLSLFSSIKFLKSVLNSPVDKNLGAKLVSKNYQYLYFFG